LQRRISVRVHCRDPVWMGSEKLVDQLKRSSVIDAVQWTLASAVGCAEIASEALTVPYNQLDNF